MPDVIATEDLQTPADQKAANKLSLERAQIAEDVTEARALYAQQLAELDAWLTDRTAAALKRIDRIDTLLSLWHQGHFDEDNPTTNTVKLMGSTLSTRKPPKKWTLVADEADIVAFLGDDHPAVKITRKLLTSGLDGEVLTNDDGEVLARKARGERKFNVEGLGDV